MILSEMYVAKFRMSLSQLLKHGGSLMQFSEAVDVRIWPFFSIPCCIAAFQAVLLPKNANAEVKELRQKSLDLFLHRAICIMQHGYVSLFGDTKC